MARCPSCNQFASNELEIDNVDVNCDGDYVEVTAYLFLISTCCSGIMATANPSDTFEIPEVEHLPDCDDLFRSFDAELTTEDPTDWFDGKGRGARHFYGVEGTITVTCDTCGAEASIEYRVAEQASSFDAF